MRLAHPLELAGAHPVANVLRSRQPVLLESMTADFQRKIAQGSEHFQLMQRLQYHSAVVVPLVARQHVLGTLSLLRMEGAGSFSQDDLVLAEDLARRAALAIDNARLFEATRHLARSLQESLLPRALPEIPGVQITGPHRAAAQGQEVGGDFYDAFTVSENRWGIAIGDGEQLHLEVAVAGHPAPLVLRGDGTVQRIPAAGPMLGVSAAVEYLPERVVLAPADAIVLYTDGLTDARAPTRILSETDLV